MDPEEIDDIKDYVFDTPDQLIVSTVEQMAEDGHYVGTVTWSATPPAGFVYQTHKFSILDAIETALVICETNYKDEWICGSRKVIGSLRSLPHFSALPLRHLSNGILRIGRFDSKQVMAVVGAPPALPDENTAFIGCGRRACLFRIIDL